MSPLSLGVVAIALALGVCFALWRYWRRGPKPAELQGRAAATRLRASHADLARLGVLGSARSSPLLDPAVIDAPRLHDSQSPNHGLASECGSLWTRTFYERKRSGRQLRLTLTKPRVADGVLKRQVVVFHVRRAVPRTREATFDLPEVTLALISGAELDALVEQSFAQAHALLCEAAAARPAERPASPAPAPSRAQQTTATVRPIREATQTGALTKDCARGLS